MRNSFFIFTWLVSLIIISCSPQQATQSPEPIEAPSPTVAPRPTPPGDMVDVGGYQLYLYCTGTGSPTVILEAGLEVTLSHGSLSNPKWRSSRAYVVMTAP